MGDSDKSVDFKAVEDAAITAYLKRQEFYQRFAEVVRRIVEESIKRQDIKVHSVQHRAKSPSSFGAKAAQPSEISPLALKYTAPFEQITDLVGVRVIAYFPSTLAALDVIMAEEFEIRERSDKGAELLEENKFGYQSIHYLVTLGAKRATLPEYAPFANCVAEIQVRTILQHAWAEIEHDIQYKSESVIPAEIRRRFMCLAGVLEIADREFQAIQDADLRLKEEARAHVEGGQLDKVEITPDSLKAFLDKAIGSDGRISEFSYNWTARLLKKLGFRTLEQVEKCIRGYDDDRLSRVAAGGRLGQTTRFELMLLAGMGSLYIERHLWASEPWHAQSDRASLDRLRSAGIEIRSYDPTVET
jgi:ppGpp synthetase/RelA/SpoT-type nucleotidyltranferase